MDVRAYREMLDSGLNEKKSSSVRRRKYRINLDVKFQLLNPEMSPHPQYREDFSHSSLYMRSISSPVAQLTKRGAFIGSSLCFPVSVS